tara:strand:+ start:50240 stop:51535 length:1296 start_codon:yes stop_codon:yes gene_type:complete
MSNISFSAVVSGLYHSSVELKSQQNSDREQAFNQALVKTLLKVSGQRDLVSDPNILKVFFPAERYVQSFSYKENPRYLAYVEYQKQIAAQEQSLKATASDTLNNKQNESLEFSVSDPNKIDPSTFDPVPLPYLLEVDFATQALEARMIKSNLPIWGKVRPEIMYWIVIESEGVRELVGSTKPSFFKDDLLSVSSRYALPVTLPFSDELDRGALNMSELWGLFPDAIDQAKLRYSSDGNLMVRVYQSMTNTWSANWHFSINGMSYTGQLHNASILLINDEIMSFLSSILVKRFSITSSDLSTNHDITLEVMNINSFKDYVDIQNFLEDVSQVKSSSLDWLEGSVMSFLLELNGSPEQFQEYLGLSGKLQFISSSTKEVLSDPIHYEQEKTVIDELVEEPLASDELVEEAVTSKFIRVEKYKWLSATPETIKK